MKNKGKHGRAVASDGAQASARLPADARPIDRWQTALLAALVALLVARTLVPEDPGSQNGYGAPFNVLWIVLACAWLLGQLRSGFVRLRFGLIDALMLALVAWHTVSALTAFYIGSPRPAINALWDWVAIGATLILARQIIQTARDARAVIVVMLGLACGLSATAVHQYFVTIPADVRSYEAAKDSTESLYEQTGQWMPPDSTVRQQFENRLNSRLPAATFALSNSLAGFIVPWFVILFAITVAARRAALLTAGAIGLALMSVCLFLTGSRSGGLAVLVGSLWVVAISAWTSRLPRSILRTAAVAIIVAAIAALAIGFGTSAGRVALSAAERSLAFRFEYWRATLAMIRDFPWLGCGPGQFQDYYATYKMPEASEVVQDAHNWLLEVWATAGTPAAAFLVAVIIAIIVRTWRAERAAGLGTNDSQWLPPNNLTATRSGPNAAVFGGVAGAALGTAIAWLSGFPIAWMHLALVVVGIAGSCWVWRSWIQVGNMPRWLPLVAVVTLLVNLLAAGGIGYPSIAGSLWVLVAIGLNSIDSFDDYSLNSTSTSRAPNFLGSKFGRWTVCAILAAVLASAIWTEYLPVMACRLQLSIADAAQASNRADQVRSALEAATVADSWSTEAAARLAAQRFADYQALSTPTQRQILQEADASARRLAPHRSSAWAQSAEFAAAIHRDSGSVEDLDAASRYFERAIELFPSNAELRSKAAKFWQAAGANDRARAAAAEALRLDDLMRASGHNDRVLNPAVRQEMETIARLTS